MVSPGPYVYCGKRRNARREVFLIIDSARQGAGTNILRFAYHITVFLSELDQGGLVKLALG